MKFVSVEPETGFKQNGSSVKTFKELALEVMNLAGELLENGIDVTCTVERSLVFAGETMVHEPRIIVYHWVTKRKKDLDTGEVEKERNIIKSFHIKDNNSDCKEYLNGLLHTTLTDPKTALHEAEEQETEEPETKQ